MLEAPQESASYDKRARRLRSRNHDFYRGFPSLPDFASGRVSGHDGEYFLLSPVHPGVQIAINVIL